MSGPQINNHLFCMVLLQGHFLEGLIILISTAVQGICLVDSGVLHNLSSCFVHNPAINFQRVIVAKASQGSAVMSCFLFPQNVCLDPLASAGACTNCNCLHAAAEFVTGLGPAGQHVQT